MRAPLVIIVMIVGLVVGGGATTARALPNLVANGGFEQGSFAGWTMGGNTGATFVQSRLSHEGDFAAALGPVNYSGILSQLLNTVAGDTYEVSFWFLQPSAPPNLFSASFGGQSLLTRVNTRSAATGWSQYLFQVVATNTLSLLEFRFRDDPGYEYLDDIAVRDLTPHPPTHVPQGPQEDPLPVPEPGTLLLLGSGLMGAAIYSKRRRDRKG